MKFIYSILFSLFLITVINAQDEFPKIESSDFPGMKINRTETYDGNSLWGYIDGGADLYLEFGFAKLTAQEVEYDSNKYRVDIYKMKDAEAAFGIFSVSKFKCSSKSLSKLSCVTEYQSQAAKGSYYISVVNEKGTQAEQKFTQNLAEKLLSRIKETDYTIPKPLDVEQFADAVKFANGPLGVQNSIADWETMFTGLTNFKFLFANVEEGNKFIFLSIIKFSSAADCALFLDSLLKRAKDLPKDVTTVSKKLNETDIIYGETNKQDKSLQSLVDKN